MIAVLSAVVGAVAGAAGVGWRIATAHHAHALELARFGERLLAIERALGLEEAPAPRRRRTDPPA